MACCKCCCECCGPPGEKTCCKGTAENAKYCCNEQACCNETDVCCDPPRCCPENTTCCGTEECCLAGEHCCDGACQAEPCTGCETDADCYYYPAFCSGSGDPGCSFACEPGEGYYYPATDQGLADAIAYINSFGLECGTCSVEAEYGKCCDNQCYPDLAGLPTCAPAPVVCPP